MNIFYIKTFNILLKKKPSTTLAHFLYKFYIPESCICLFWVTLWLLCHLGEALYHRNQFHCPDLWRTYLKGKKEKDRMEKEKIEIK